MSIKISFSLILWIISLEAFKAECNFHGNSSTNELGTWHDWKVTKKACIQKDYLIMDPPSKVSPIILFAGDWNTSIVEINEKKRTLEIDLMMELTWQDVRIDVNFYEINDSRVLPPVR